MKTFDDKIFWTSIVMGFSFIASLLMIVAQDEKWSVRWLDLNEDGCQWAARNGVQIDKSSDGQCTVLLKMRNTLIGDDILIELGERRVKLSGRTIISSAAASLADASRVDPPSQKGKNESTGPLWVLLIGSILSLLIWMLPPYPPRKHTYR